MKKLFFINVVLLSTLMFYSCSKHDQNKTYDSDTNVKNSEFLVINNYEEEYSSGDSSKSATYHELQYWPYIEYICAQPVGNCLPEVEIKPDTKSVNYELFIKLQKSIMNDETAIFFQDEDNWKSFFPDLYEPFLNGLVNNNIILKEESVTYENNSTKYFYLGHQRNEQNIYDHTTVVFAMRFLIEDN